MKQKADLYENPLWTAYYDGTHGSSTELHYYVNINDDNRLPNNYDIMRFDLELWRVDRYFGLIKKWDKKLVSGIDCYTISEPGHSETLKVDKKDEFEQVKYEAQVKVETIGVEKANTIAIYETNGTVFNGHYQEQERMNVIQLYVNDSGSGTPFEAGLNTIVIPTSLFAETVFNAHVQNETLSETTIYRDDEELFKFISVGRDGYTKQACEEIDFIIIRFDISSEDAMEVLNLLLECLVNETTNETGIVYSYVSTKENDNAAVMMNLPFSVLGLIPWYCNFENSPMGSKPETFGDWFWKPLKTIGMAIVGVIITIGMAFVELFMMMVDFFTAIFMDILPILAFILWLIIRAIILIFIWIIFILSLVVVFVSFLIISGIIALLCITVDLDFSLNLNRIQVENEEITANIGYRVLKARNEFFDLEYPIISYYISKANTTFEIKFGFFTDSLELPQPNLSEDFYEGLYGKQQSSSNPQLSAETSEKQFISFLGSISSIMGLAGALMSLVGGLMTGASYLSPIFLALSLSLIGFSLTTFITGVINSGFTVSNCLGFAIGFCISMVFSTLALDIWGLSFQMPLIMSFLIYILAIVSYIMTAYSLLTFNAPPLMKFIQIGFGVVFLTAGAIAIASIPNWMTSKLVSIIFTIIFLIHAITFIILPIIILISGD